MKQESGGASGAFKPLGKRVWWPSLIGQREGGWGRGLQQDSSFVGCLGNSKGGPCLGVRMGKALEVRGEKENSPEQAHEFLRVTGMLPSF